MLTTVETRNIKVSQETGIIEITMVNKTTSREVHKVLIETYFSYTTNGITNLSSMTAWKHCKCTPPTLTVVISKNLR